MLTAVALTKVDRVQPGDVEYWLRLLENEVGRYFVTRLHAPDTEGLQTTLDEDRVNEKKTLANKPWCSLDKGQLGTKALTGALSRRLADMIKKR